MMKSARDRNLLYEAVNMFESTLIGHDHQSLGHDSVELWGTSTSAVI